MRLIASTRPGGRKDTAGNPNQECFPKKKKSFWKRKDVEYGFILQDDLYSKMKRQHAGESTVIQHQLLKKTSALPDFSRKALCRR